MATKPWLLSRIGDRCSYHVSGGQQVNFDRVVDVQKQRALICHSPLPVRNREVNRRGPAAQRYPQFGWHGDLAVDAVDIEHAVHSYRRLSLRRNRALNAVRAKRNFRIALALQDFAVHLAVADSAATGAAFGVDHNLTADFSGGRIELHGSVLQLKGSMHGVKYVAQRELDGGLRRIKLQCRTLSRG